jgi:hypothetical protein
MYHKHSIWVLQSELGSTWKATVLIYFINHTSIYLSAWGRPQKPPVWIINITGFWNVTPCKLANFRWQQAPLKRQYPPTNLHGVICQKTVTLIITAVKTSDVTRVTIWCCRCEGKADTFEAALSNTLLYTPEATIYGPHRSNYVYRRCRATEVGRLWGLQQGCEKLLMQGPSTWAHREQIYIATMGWRYCVYTQTHRKLNPRYNDIGWHDTSSTASDILWYPLIPHC